MARRRVLLPALRQPQQLENKGWGGGYGYGGGVTPAINVLGMKDRAAGWDLDAVIEQGYERIPWVFRAVDLIAGTQARLPFQLTDEAGNIVTSHPLLRVLNRKANPLESGRQFRKRLSAQLLLSKRGVFVEVTKNNGNQISRLDLLPPDRVRVVPDPGGDYVDYYEFTRYDGVIRNLAPERVRWIRDPHPLDPFSGQTPLEAAGYSVELDHLARVYNVNFINRDARPGGIVGVDTDGLDEAELERIERKLAPGAQHAGQTIAIGTGPGGIRYVDTSAKPRDMAYETTSEKSKREILAAFGVPESKIGDSSGRTYDNAAQEDYNWWNDSQLGHLDIISSAFLDDVPDTINPGFDLSSVEALELPLRRAREEARREWTDGLRTADEYRPLAELPVFDNAHSRALWISPAKAPVPGRPEDAAALGLGDPNAINGLPAGDPSLTDPNAGGIPPEGGEPVDPNAPSDLGGAAAAVAEAQGSDVPADPGAAAAAVAEAQGQQVTTDPGAAAGAVEEALETKAATLAELPAPVEVATEYDPGEEESRRVELAVAATLDAFLSRQAGVVQARLESPKTRMGTRYWAAENADDARTTADPIDLTRVVDGAKWAGELQQALMPVIQPAAQESAAGLLTYMAGAGALVAPVAAAVVAGRAAPSPVPAAEAITQAAGQASVGAVLAALAIAEEALDAWLDARVADLTDLMVDQQAPLPSLVDLVKKLWSEKGRTFANSVAVSIAQAITGISRDNAVNAVLPQGDSEVIRRWRTREDERVRDSHREANGQARALGELFEVGGHSLRYPSDPFAPATVSRWCRCWLTYFWAPGATFRLPEPETIPLAA